MALETNVYVSESEIKEISLSCVDIQNEKGAYKILNELAEKGIFAVPRENKLYFTALNDDEATEKMLEEELSKIGVKEPIIRKDCKKINPEENIDYFRIIMSNAIRYQIFNKLKNLNYELLDEESGIYICTEKGSIDDIKICKGVKLKIDVFDNKVEISADYKVKVLDKNKRPTKKIRAKIRELSVISPKDRYKEILDVMKNLFENYDSIVIWLSQDMAINLERVKVLEKLPIV